MGRIIDAYLDELFDRLAGTGAAGRRSLADAEDHLRTAADEAIARGAEPIVAEQTTVDRFGRASRIAGGFQLLHNGGASTPVASIRGLLAGTGAELRGDRPVWGDRLRLRPVVRHCVRLPCVSTVPSSRSSRLAMFTTVRVRHCDVARIACGRLAHVVISPIRAISHGHSLRTLSSEYQRPY
jgi:hypothetical protein